MMKTKKRSLYNMLAMAFTFALVIVFAGFVGKVDARAEDMTCKATVVVKDKATGEVLNDAKVIFVDYYTNEPIDVTQNEDGTYNLPYDEWGMWYRYYATCEGYKDSRDSQGKGIKTPCIEKPEITLSAILLEKYPPEERLQQAITDAQSEIEKYLDKNDYDPDQIAEIDEIIKTYLGKIDEIEVGEETEDSADEKIADIDNIVADAKDELDSIYTSQNNINEQYADMISFVATDGTKISLARDTYGVFSITLGLLDKGGVFQVNGNDADTNVTWNAEKELFYQSAGQAQKFQYIDNNFKKGTFLNQGRQQAAIPDEVEITTGTIKDCSATFIKEGKPITVTFDLNVVYDRIDSLIINNVPEKVTLKRNEDLEYINVLEYGNEKNNYYVTVDYHFGNDGWPNPNNLIIESLTNDIATVDDDLTIHPVKAGTASFKATYTDETGEYIEEFQIEFVMSDKEKKEISDAQNVDELIAGLNADVKLEDEKAILAARDAFNKLSDNAKTRLSEGSLDKLTKAEEKIKVLKEEENKKKVEAAEKRAQAAEQRAAEAEKRAQAAENKLNEAKKVVLPKLTLKVKAAKRKATLTWKKASKADGYVIYRSTKKNGKYKKIKVVKGAKNVKYTDKKVKSKKTYYYKVCAYKGKVNGPLCAAKKVKVK